MSAVLTHREVILTESDKEALNEEDVNVLNIPKDWPALSSRPSKFRFWMSGAWKKQYLDCVATQQSVFDDPLPPFDVQARWTLREERRVKHKLNRKVLILYILSSFFFGQNVTGLPLSIIGFIFTKISLSENALKANIVILLLGSSLTKFVSRYSRYLLLKLGPRRLVSTGLLAVGLGSIAQYWISNIPMLVLAQAIYLFGQYASQFYNYCILPFCTFQEYIQIKIWDYPACALVDLVFTLVSCQVISIGPAGDPSIWRRIWVVYGLSSCLLSILFLYLMPPSPLEVSSYKVLWKWFTSQELTILVNRMVRHNPVYVNSPKRVIRLRVKDIASIFYNMQSILYILATFGLSVIAIIMNANLIKYLVKKDESAGKLVMNS
ncbi:uncharacterized protein V1516DRAFT_693057 [Lipomyces oligophaga]|uniref:uncharacterized protein n=1 Tax=Lipomyces oligophaga TaxID=45792 RepID=UPI0034CD3772